MNKKSGIYMIRNKINNKVYIGKSTNIEKRFYEHQRELSKNIHNNIHLQRSWNQYGEKSFKFIIIEECESNLLNEREQYYIKKYNSHDRDNGFNMTFGGDGSLGLKHTDESKKKISEIQIGRKLTEEWKENISNSNKGKMPKNINMLLDYNKKQQREIVQISIDSKEIKYWSSIQGCARETGLLATNIAKCLKGLHKTCGGNVFFYKEYYEENIDNIEIEIINRTTKIKQLKGIVKLSLGMKFVAEYDTMKELHEIGFDRHIIRRCCVGIKKSYNGFKWMYKYDYELMKTDRDKLNQFINT